MNSQRPPQRPRQHPPLSREEEMLRRQEYLRRRQRQQLQRRVTILVIAALFILMTILLIAVAVHRHAAPTGQENPDTGGEQIVPPTQTTPAQTTANKPTDEKITICIDPGHGFDDPGASSAYLGDYTEKDITLAIGRKLRDLLLARGYNVIMTHDTNEIPAGTPAGEQYLFGLAKRTDFANANQPDLYLSIHGDAYDDPSVQGSRVYFQTISGESNDAITTIAQNFVDALTIAFPDAPKAPLLKAMADDEAYYVLRNVEMHAVLVEVGFATNPTDAANMLDETWQAKIAEALADGVDMNFAK